MIEKWGVKLSSKKYMEMETFFDMLSERKWIENDLSDVTRALCEASKKFKKLFLDFCFNTDTPEKKIIYGFLNDILEKI